MDDFTRQQKIGCDACVKAVVEIGRRGCVDSRRCAAKGIVHQYIHLPQPRNYLGHKRRDRFRRALIKGHSHMTHTGQRRREFRCPLPLAACDHHRRPGLCQRPAHGCAQPTRPAGDNRHFAA